MIKEPTRAIINVPFLNGPKKALKKNVPFLNGTIAMFLLASTGMVSPSDRSRRGNLPLKGL